MASGSPSARRPAGTDALSDEAVRVLRAVLAHPQAEHADLVTHTGLGVALVDAALAELGSIGLLRPSDVTTSGWRTVHPRVAFGGLIAEREAALSADLTALATMRDLVDTLTDDYATASASLEGETITRLGDRDKVLTQLSELVGDVRMEVAALVTSKPSPRSAEEGRRLDEELLGRGVSLRSICLDSFRRDRATMKGLLASVASGVQVRTSPTLPSRMIIFDRRVAVIADDPEDPASSALLVRNNSTVVLLSELFDLLWRDALPVAAESAIAPEGDGAAPHPMELAVLELLAAGHKDEAIARATGQSTRTVRRVISGLCDRLGARGRFDLALRASGRGWV